MTLIEMLIGMAITLVMMAAVVNLFANIGEGVRFRRAGMEMNGQLRLARARLFKDLAGATCEAVPKSSKEDNEKADGYLEIVEGEWSDKYPSSLMDGDSSNGELDYAASQVPSGGDPQIVIDSDLSNPVRTASPNDVTNGGGLGDYDDILALTVRSESEPFVGRWLNNSTGLVETIESDLAEVIWFAVENPADGSLGEPGMRTVYRRVLLIAPWLQPADLQVPGGVNLPTDLLAFYRENDISVRLNNAGTLWVPNDLSELVKRENRFGHFLDIGGAAIGYPFAINQLALRANSYTAPPVGIIGPLRPHGEVFDVAGNDERTGEDVMINNVLAFDVRVFDPGAPLIIDTVGPAVALEPSDRGWFTPSVATIQGYGSFVDLGWDPTFTSLTTAPEAHFQYRRQAGWPSSLYPGTLTGYPSAYDTWSFHYENDDIDQDNNDIFDDYINPLDDDDSNGSNDAGEREAPPPYDVPLRGVQVKLRIYETDSRQIREATVTRNFTSD